MNMHKNARSDGFRFSAEPTFPFAPVDSGLIVAALSRHVVDALAGEAAYVALNRAHGVAESA